MPFTYYISFLILIIVAIYVMRLKKMDRESIIIYEGPRWVIEVGYDANQVLVGYSFHSTMKGAFIHYIWWLNVYLFFIRLSVQRKNENRVPRKRPATTTHTGYTQ